MNASYLKKLLEDVRNGNVSVDTALRELELLPYEDLGFARVDHHRALRTGFPEIVLGEWKSPAQIAAIMERLAQRNHAILCTRASPQAYAAVKRAIPEAVYYQTARAIVVNRPVSTFEHRLPGITVISAGTGDLPVAEEAALTAEVMGHIVERYYDVGVAGIHRIFALLDHLRRSNVILVVAGMEGALASVVAGLVSVPVIAIPTSVGYGTSFAGLSALLTMLNTCSVGLAVVNIDNGVGGGVLAAMINKQAHNGNACGVDPNFSDVIHTDGEE